MARSTSTPNKVSPKIAARIRELLQQGLSSRRIATALAAEGHSLSHVTVAAVAKRPAGKRMKAAAVDKLAAEVQAAIDAAEPGSIDHLRARASQVRDWASRTRLDAANGDATASMFATLVKLEADLVARIAALTPPPAPDPAIDPANVAARDLLIAHIEGLLAGAEQGEGEASGQIDPSLKGRRA